MAEDSLTTTYTRNRRSASDAELLQWLDQRTATPPQPKALPQPQAPVQQPSAIGAGVTAGVEAVTGGASKVWQGLSDLITSPELGIGPESVRDAKTIFDGLMSIASSPAVGVGAAVEQKFKNMSPQQAAKEVIPGGPWSLAEIIRKTLMVDIPFLRKEEHTPETEAALQAPMTAGEVANIVSALASLPVGARAVRRLRGGGSPTPEILRPGEGPQPREPVGALQRPQAEGMIVEPEGLPVGAPGAPQRALGAAPEPSPPQPPGQLPGGQAALPVPGPRGPIPGVGAVLREPEGMTATQAEALAATRQRFPGFTPETAEEIRLRERTPAPAEPPRAGAPPAEVPRERAPAVEAARAETLPAPVEQMVPAVEMEFRQVLREAGVPEGKPAKGAKGQHAGKTVEPGTVMLSDPEEVRILIRDVGGLDPRRLAGQDPKSIPKRMLKKDGVAWDELVDEIATAQSADPKVVERQLIDTLDRYERTSGEGVPAGERPEIRAAQPPADVPVELAEWQNAPPSQRKALIDFFRAEGALFDESGKIDTGLMARIAIGGVLGCATGDDPAECARNALIGAGVGAALSARLAQTVKTQWEQRGQAGAQAGQAAPQPAQRGGAKVQASEQPYQPNYARLDITPEVRNVMLRVHRSIKEDILERRGPAKSHDRTMQEALRRIQSGNMTPERVLTLGDQEMLGREDILAARILSVRSFDHAVEVKNRVLAGEPLPEGSYATAISVAGAMGRNTRVAQTRIAQALESNKIVVGRESVGYRPEDVANLAADISAGMTDKELALLHSQVKSPEQMGKVATFMSLFPKAGLQALYFSYLSGKTVFRNLVGNTTMLAMAPAEIGLARYMPVYWGKDRYLPGSGTNAARALGEGIIDHIRMIRNLDAIDAEAQRIGVERFPGKVELVREADAFQGLGELAGGEGSALAHLGEWADKVTDFPSMLMERTDLVSRSLNGRIALRMEAMHQAAREGLTAEAIETRIAQIEHDITQLSEAGRTRVTEFAGEQTFTKEFSGRILKALAEGPQNQWLNLVYRSWLVPFFRTPAQMLNQTMARMPVLNVLSQQFWSDFMAGGRRQQVAQSRLAWGTAAVGAFMYLESQGLVTGNKPHDPGLSGLWRDYPDRSWWDEVSGKWRSYDGLGPLTSLIAGAADTSMAVRRLPESDAAHVFTAYVLSQLNSLDSRTFTQSLSNFLEVVKGQGADSQVERGMDFIRKQIAGWFKPGVVREIESVFDPVVRRPIRSGAFDDETWGGSVHREIKMLFDDVRSGWPGWSSAKDAEGNFIIPPDRDPITGDQTVIESWPFNPFPGRAPKPLPFTRPENMPKEYTADVKAELQRLRGAGLHPLPDWIGGTNPGADAGFSPENLRAGIRLTPQEKDRWVVLMTTMKAEDDGKTYKEALTALMADPLYWEQSDGLRGTDGGKAGWIQAYERKYRQMAEMQLYSEAPKLFAKVLERQAERKIQGVPTAQQPEARERFGEAIRQLVPGATPAPRRPMTLPPGSLTR